MKHVRILLIPILAAAGCSQARVISDPSTNTAYVVQSRSFNQKIMKCSAGNPSQPVCTVMAEESK